MSKTIPGLTASAFRAGSRHSVTETPTLVQGSVAEEDGSFEFCWTAKGTHVYTLRASGNLITSDTKNHCFSVDCNCPSFANQAMDRVPNVCKHLFAALTSVMDDGKPQAKKPAASASSAPKPQRQRFGVIDLSLDESDDEEPKKKSSETKNAARSIPKRAAMENGSMCLPSRKKQATGGALETPIKLFCTDLDTALRRKNSGDHSHWCWTQCRTLREMILGGENDGEPIQWLCISNYLIDFNFLLNEVPELVSIPRVVVFYGAGGDTTLWQRAAAPNRVDFVQLDPKAAPRSNRNPLRYSFRSGTHHTKMFMVGRAHSIRVVVHTANLIFCDIHQKAQAAYIEDFPLKQAGFDRRSEFEDTLVQYVDSYGYTNRQNWLGNREQLTECLRRYEFSNANGVLIPSIPGYYDLNAQNVVGHLKLKQAVARYTMSGSENTTASVRPIICQFSSLGGSVSENYLRQLQASMDTRKARLDYNPNDTSEICLQLIWPTVREIHNSVEGAEGGGSVPGKLKNVTKGFLRRRMRKWTTNDSAQRNPLVKPKNVPHIKTFYQVSRALDSMDWFVLASHNLSTQAWGRIQRSQNSRDGLCHYVESWELGVFLSPAVLGVERLVYWNGDNRPGAATIPIPYKVYIPDEYDSDDEPWAVDGRGGLD